MQIQMDFEIAASFKSATQRARVVTELWGERNLYCANCESPTLTRTRPNTQAIDFTCPLCRETVQLKCQTSAFSRRIVDAAYEAMRRAVEENRTPNLVAVQYDAVLWRIKNAILIPKFAFSMSVIEKRPPLATTARRAGWTGCNILLCNIPPDAKIALVREGVPLGPNVVRGQYNRLKPLTRLDADLRGWTLDVLKIIRMLGKARFSLADVYVHDEHLRHLHPSNTNTKPKIRQQLQKLRDLGIVEFLGGGEYQLRGVSPDQSKEVIQ